MSTDVVYSRLSLTVEDDMTDLRKPLITPAAERIDYAVTALDDIIGKLVLTANTYSADLALYAELRATADRLSDVMVALR